MEQGERNCLSSLAESTCGDLIQLLPHQFHKMVCLVLIEHMLLLVNETITVKLRD